MKELSKIINFIWTVADDILRDVFVRGKYRDVILPMTVIRRLDCLLEPSKESYFSKSIFKQSVIAHFENFLTLLF